MVELDFWESFKIRGGDGTHPLEGSKIITV
jgi:hypothetical protein